MKLLGIIPARSGSKGIKNKNLIPINGYPLIRYTIDQAVACESFDKIVVSTDSAEYQEKFNLWYPGCAPYLQPSNISRDSTRSNVYIRWVLDWVEQNVKQKFDTFVLLEPTSPLRYRGTINEALKMFNDKKAKALISVCDSHRCHPSLSFEMQDKSGKLLIPDTPPFRRQEVRPFWHPTGTIYIANIDWYRKHETFITSDTVGYKVNEIQDHEIDNPWDVKIISALMDEIK